MSSSEDFEAYEGRAAPGKMKRSKKKEDREEHNNNERLRRNALNDSYSELQKHLPQLADKGKQSRLKIVAAAIDYMDTITIESQKRMKKELALRKAVLIKYNGLLEKCKQEDDVDLTLMHTMAQTLAIPPLIDGMIGCGLEEILESYRKEMTELGLDGIERSMCPAIYDVNSIVYQ